MDNPKGIKNAQDPKFTNPDMDMTDAASSTDFTGLIPFNPRTDEEVASYKDIHKFGMDTAKNIDKMLDAENNKPILHGNCTKIGNKKDVLTCQSYRSYTEPEQYDFNSLPGSEEDLKNARENNK